MLCWLTCLITTSAFMPNYLVDYLHMPTHADECRHVRHWSRCHRGYATPSLVFRQTGPQTSMALSSPGAVVALLLLARTPRDAVLLFALLFMVHFFNNALITLTVGPLCSEAVPAGLMATASGLVIAVGELIGGGLTPVLVGHFAQHFGIEHLFWLPIATVSVGFILCLGIRESSSLKS